MSMTPQRQFAIQIVQQLRDAGFQSLWAGGCVRDALLGLPPKDYDVATDATPDQVQQVFGHRRTLPLGASFGVITVLGPKPAGQIEVATFRTDGGYSDGRHPDQIEFSTPEHDAQRRDFTINGLFFDPLTEQVHDFVGGQQDLAAGKIRAIGDPECRIAEDKLRMLRAVRFAARFDFAIDPDTLTAITAHANEITQVSGERIGAEMRSMLTHPHRAVALQLLRTTQLETFVLPELVPVEGEAWQTLLERLPRLQAPSLALVLAALFAQLANATPLPAVATRWKLPNRDNDRATWLVAQLPVVKSACSVQWPQLQRVLIHDGAPELVDLLAAIAGDDSAEVQLCRQKLALPADQLNPAPLVTGGDLIAAGLRPGPKFGDLLESIRDAQLLGQITTADQAIEMARAAR